MSEQRATIAAGEAADEAVATQQDAGHRKWTGDDLALCLWPIMLVNMGEWFTMFGCGAACVLSWRIVRTSWPDLARKVFAMCVAVFMIGAGMALDGELDEVFAVAVARLER